MLAFVSRLRFNIACLFKGAFNSVPTHSFLLLRVILAISGGLSTVQSLLSSLLLFQPWPVFFIQASY